MRKTRLLLPFVAVLAAAVFFIGSAFTTDSPDNAFTYKYWRIIDPAHPEDPSNYEEVDGTTFSSLSCSGNQTICKMEAQDDGSGQPQFNVGQDGLPVVDGTYVIQRTLKNQ